MKVHLRVVCFLFCFASNSEGKFYSLGSKASVKSKTVHRQQVAHSVHANERPTRRVTPSVNNPFQLTFLAPAGARAHPLICR